MTSNLRERAAAAAATVATAGVPGDEFPGYDPGELEDIEYTDAIVNAEAVPVHTAWARVMADVKSVAKAGTFTSKNAGTYKFRGIDHVLNAVAPALRRHGVMIFPVKMVPEYRDIPTSSGGKMHECTVTVDYEITGPDGSTKNAQSIGEAVDVSDKSTTKASTQAYRNFLIAALSIPVEDARIDGDAVQHERGDRPRPRAGQYVEEICHPRTSLGRLQQIRKEITEHRLGDAIVTNENGDDEKLGELLARHGKAKQDAARAEAGA